VNIIFVSFFFINASPKGIGRQKTSLEDGEALQTTKGQVPKGGWHFRHPFPFLDWNRTLFSMFFWWAIALGSIADDCCPEGAAPFESS